MDNSDSNNSKCRIIVDAMGGDFAPQNAVVGAVQALQQNNSFELFLVGKEDEIKNVLQQNQLQFDDNHIINASQVIEMEDIPTTALKTKPDSSICVGAKWIKEKKADAFVSAGNTGAMMAASTLIMGRIQGVGRPTIGSIMPTISGKCVMFDAGASVDSKARHLLEYAIMGSIYVKEIYGVDNPSIGMLSVGEEDTKGNTVSLEAFEMIKKTNLNFKGNIEGGDILKGTVNVVVCDGFVGNIILKFGESVLTLLKYKFKEYADQGTIKKLKIGLVRGAMREILKDFDYQEHGGVPLLGVNGISIIGHGSSTPKAIMNMVLKAKEMHDRKLIERIQTSLKFYSNIS